MNEFQKVLTKAKEREASHHRRQREAVYADAANHPERWRGVDVHRRAMANWWHDPAFCVGGFRVRSETELGALTHIKAEAQDAQPGRVTRLVALNEAQISQYRDVLREVLREAKQTPPHLSPQVKPEPVIAMMPIARMALEILPNGRPPTTWPCSAEPCMRLGQVDDAPAMVSIVTLPAERIAWISQASARGTIEIEGRERSGLWRS